MFFSPKLPTRNTLLSFHSSSKLTHFVTSSLIVEAIIGLIFVNGRGTMYPFIHCWTSCSAEPSNTPARCLVRIWGLVSVSRKEWKASWSWYTLPTVYWWRDRRICRDGRSSQTVQMPAVEHDEIATCAVFSNGKAAEHSGRISETGSLWPRHVASVGLGGLGLCRD